MVFMMLRLIWKKNCKMNTCNNNGCMNMIIPKRKYCSHKCYSLDKKNKSSHMLGKKHSEETKNKISKKNLEVAKDPKYIKKLSESHKGQKAWNKDKIFRKFKKCKRLFCDNLISNSYSRKYCSKECYLTDRRENNPAKRKEVREKISNSLKGRTAWNKDKTGIYSEETLNKIREARAKQIFSEESGNKKSETMKEFWADPMNKENRIKNNTILQKGKKLTEEHKQKIGKGNKGKVHSEEQSLKMSKIRKQEWQDPEYVKKQMKSRNVMPNKTELNLQNIINSITNNFIFIGDGKEIIGGKCPDFIDPINNKIIELYGDYWHRGQDPNDRINYFKNYGYDTLVIWESELKNVDNLKNKLEVFVHE